jgi:D-amino-acid dehydrogenase
MQRIAHYSKACLKELCEDTGIAFDHGTGGVLQLFRTEGELAGAAKSTRVLAKFGVMHRILDAEGVLAVEPALGAAAAEFAGGLHLPDDETGDCHKFTVALAELLRRRGVVFKFNTSVKTAASRRRPHCRRHHRSRHAQRRRLCCGAGQRCRARSASAWT